MTDYNYRSISPAIRRPNQTFYPEVFHGPRVEIFDTDRILNHLKEYVQAGDAVTKLGTGPLFHSTAYASLHVFKEMYQSDNLGNVNKFQKLAKQSEKEGWARSAAEFQRVFEGEYLGQIAFVDVGSLFAEHALTTKVAEKDIKDAPTAQLAVLLSGVNPIVYSHDGSLRDAGLAVDNLKDVFAAWYQVDEANAIFGGTYSVMAGTVVVVDEATKAIAAWLKVPQWVVLIVVGAISAWAIRKPESGHKFTSAIKVIGQLLSDINDRGSKGSSVLISAALPANDAPTIEQAVAKVLVEIAPGQGLLVREIIEWLEDFGYPTQALQPKKLHQILRSTPCFTEVKRYRWQLGEIMAAPRP